MNKLLTEEQLSERISVSMGTLRRWRLESRGPKFHKLGSLVRYSEYDLEIWLQGRPSGGESETARLPPKPARKADLLRNTG